MRQSRREESVESSRVVRELSPRRVYSKAGPWLFDMLARVRSVRQEIKEQSDKHIHAERGFPSSTSSCFIQEESSQLVRWHTRAAWFGAGPDCRSQEKASATGGSGCVTLSLNTLQDFLADWDGLSVTGM